jgi:hypothetical protein
MTLISFMIVAGVAGFLLMLALKIGPIYMDHYKVVASLEALKSDQELATRTRDEILRKLEKHWDIDMIDSVTKDNVVITKGVGELTVQIVYDVTKPIAGNVDVIVHFDDAIEVKAN